MVNVELDQVQDKDTDQRHHQGGDICVSYPLYDKLVRLQCNR